MASTLSPLLSKSSLDDHDEILAAATAELKKNRSDITAQHVRLVALVKLDRYADALRCLDEGGKPLKQRAPLEHAYTLYKNGQLGEAQSVLENSGLASRDLQHLRAQTAYKSEDFNTARALYAKLKGGAEEDDLRINNAALDAQLCWVGKGAGVRRKLERADLDQFETTYNAACGNAARGELKQAEMLLNRAKDLLNASDLTEADKKAELVPILVQQLYVYVRQGKTSEAEKLASSLSVSSISDSLTRHIAQTNKLLVPSAASSNPYLTHRLFHSSSNLPSTDLPFSHQRSTLALNSFILDLQASKYRRVARSTQATLESAKDPLSPDAVIAGVFNAAAHTHGVPSSAASIASLQPFLFARPQDVGLALTVAQMYLQLNNQASATSTLESFLERAAPAVRHAPGLVATLVALYVSQNRHAAAKRALDNAARHWRSNNKDDADHGLLRASATALLTDPENDDLECAHDLFTTLQSHTPDDPRAAAGLVASSSAAAPLPQELLSSLPSLADLTKGIDAAALEQAGVPRLDTPMADIKRKRPAAVTAPGTTGKRRKTRPSRMPKEIVEGKEIDPERWLPMRERSYYRPKKGRKGKAGGGGGGSQGATQGGDASSASAPVQGGQVVKKKKGKGKR